MSCVCSGGSGRDGDRHTQQVTVALNLLEQNPGWISLHLDGDRFTQVKHAVCRTMMETQGDTYTYTYARQRARVVVAVGRLTVKELKGFRVVFGEGRWPADDRLGNLFFLSKCIEQVVDKVL